MLPKKIKRKGKYDMEKNRNCLLDIGVIIIGFVALILGYFFSSGVDGWIYKFKEKEIENEAIQIARVEIKEKYPERSFEIIGASVAPLYQGGFDLFPEPDITRVFVRLKEKDIEYAVHVDYRNKKLGYDNIQEVSEVRNEAERIAIKKLKEKYPERKFDIIEIKATAYNPLEIRDDHVLVRVKENNEEHIVIVNCKKDYLGNRKRKEEIVDDIQANEIIDSIKEKLNEIIKIDSDSIQYDVWNYRNDSESDRYHCFYEKFNGDIMDFLTREVSNYDGRLYICIMHHNGKEQFKIDQKNNEFMKLFDRVSVINYKFTQPSYDENVIELLDMRDIVFGGYYVTAYKEEEKEIFNSFYLYNKESQKFEDILR